ncbi:uncharacterized protein G2W53_010128 [Senna tora]|uniref:Uncharacterized protein n=1 Tax=Senna tora TaxID=362788 RepID=A0A834WZC8_9FABA|nr:uncharacterized protein G2W53_010128 [Senna tora]
MFHAPRCHSASCHSLFLGQSSGDASSSPSFPISPDSRVLAIDSLMAIDRDPLIEESRRAFVDSSPAITCLSEVPYQSAIYRLVEEDFFITSDHQSALPDYLGEEVELRGLPAKIRDAHCSLLDTQSLSRVNQLSRNVHDWDGKFMRVTAIASVNCWSPLVMPLVRASSLAIASALVGELVYEGVPSRRPENEPVEEEARPQTRISFEGRLNKRVCHILLDYSRSSYMRLC